MCVAKVASERSNKVQSDLVMHGGYVRALYTVVREQMNQLDQRTVHSLDHNIVFIRYIYLLPTALGIQRGIGSKHMTISGPTTRRSLACWGA